MGSHSIKLTKAIRDLEHVKSVQLANIFDQYSLGLYNGIELALAMMTNRDAKYFEILDNKKEISKKEPSGKHKDEE